MDPTVAAFVPLPDHSGSIGGIMSSENLFPLPYTQLTLVFQVTMPTKE